MANWSVNLIGVMADGSSYNFVENGKLSDSFDVKTSVLQGRVMPVFFPVDCGSVYLFMENVVRSGCIGLRWRNTSVW